MVKITFSLKFPEISQELLNAGDIQEPSDVTDAGQQPVCLILISEFQWFQQTLGRRRAPSPGQNPRSRGHWILLPCRVTPSNSARETNCLSSHQRPSRRVSLPAPLPVVDGKTFLKIEPSIKAASPAPLGLKPALKRINYSHLPKSAL